MRGKLTEIRHSRVMKAKTKTKIALTKIPTCRQRGTPAQLAVAERKLKLRNHYTQVWLLKGLKRLQTRPKKVEFEVPCTSSFRRMITLLTILTCGEPGQATKVRRLIGLVC